MRFLMTWLLIAASYVYGYANAAALDGIWKFERSADYYGRTPVNEAPRFSILLIHGDEVHLSEDCLIKFTKEPYLFPEIFQPLTKQGVSEKQLDVFLQKSLNFSLLKTQDVYRVVDAPVRCARPMMAFFLIGDRLVVPVGITFYTYVKSHADNQPSATVTTSSKAQESVVSLSVKSLSDGSRPILRLLQP
jgi:hypothetical protein